MQVKYKAIIPNSQPIGIKGNVAIPVQTRTVGKRFRNLPTNETRAVLWFNID